MKLNEHNSLFTGDILLRYHVPGIGPKIPDWQIEQVFDFMLQVCISSGTFSWTKNDVSRTKKMRNSKNYIIYQIILTFLALHPSRGLKNVR